MDAPTLPQPQPLVAMLAEALPLVEAGDPRLAGEIGQASLETPGAELMELTRRARYHVSRGDMEGHRLARFDRALFGS